MKLYKENGEAIPAWQLLADADPAPTGFTITSDLTEWDANGFGLGSDYKAVRDSMKQIVFDLGSGDADVGFSLLDSAQKTIACKYKIASDSVREAFAGVDTLVIYGKSYNTQMLAARTERANDTVSEIANRLPTQKLVIMSQSEAVFNAYEKYGIEGTAYGDPVSGVADYINGTGDFIGAGLRQSGYTPIGLTIEALCDLLIEILLGDG